jgi:hypothetical protein
MYPDILKPVVEDDVGVGDDGLEGEAGGTTEP